MRSRCTELVTDERAAPRGGKVVIPKSSFHVASLTRRGRIAKCRQIIKACDLMPMSEVQHDLVQRRLQR